MKQTFIYTAAVLLLATACTDDVSDLSYMSSTDAVSDTLMISDAAVSVKDGILHFASADDFFNFSLRMANSSEDERIAWEDSIGFTSMLTYADNITANIKNHWDEITDRTDIFSVSGDSLIRLDVPSTFAVAANADGYYFIGNTICKVDKTFAASVEGGDKHDADMALQGDSIGNELKFNRYEYCGTNSSSTLKSAYVDGHPYDINTHVSNDHYWLEYRIKVYLTSFEEKSNVKTILYVEQSSSNSYKRKRHWRGHHSKNSYIGVECNVLIPVYNYSIKVKPYDYSGGSNVNHRAVTSVELYNFPLTKDQPYFTKLQGKIESDIFAENSETDKPLILGKIKF